MTYNEFEANVLQWAKDRGILKNGTYQGQCLKLIEEYGELAAAWARNDREGVKDAIGDIRVVETIMRAMEESDKGASRYWGLVEKLTARMSFSGVSGFAVLVFGLSEEECIEQAWNTIKDRKGQMNAQGVFVKEAE